MKPSRVVIKLGGASLQDANVLKTFTEALKEYKKFGYQVVLVHGGGPAINEELLKRQIKWNFHQGQRITTPEMMGAVEDVLFGQVNFQLVKHFSENGLAAEGLSGAEQGLLFCTQASKILGLVGNIEKVETKVVEEILAKPGSPIPVIATLGVGSNGEKYNINADWAASRIANAIGAEYLIFLTDQKGVLDANKELIPEVTVSSLHTLIEDEIVQGGMLTKTKTILSALEGSVKAVRVMNGLDSVKGLWSNHIGTWCFKTAELSTLSSEETRYVFS